VVDRDVVTEARPRSVNDSVAGTTQAIENSAVSIMPGLGQTQQIDVAITTELVDVVESA